MNDSFKADWKELYQRFDAWWKFDNNDRPLMWIEADKEPDMVLPEEFCPKAEKDEFENNKINPFLADVRMRNHAARTLYLAEAFPTASLDFGPGAMGAFLGSRPHFTRETVWYEAMFETPEEMENLITRFDTEYYTKAVRYFEILSSLADGDYLVGIPDLIDSMDTVSAMLGPVKTLYALKDAPEAVMKGLEKLDDIYFAYFDRFRDITRNDDDIMTVQAFTILGKRVAKLQCDLCAMISPEMFDTFVAPSLRKYCAKLTHAMYHIDGEGEMCHVDTMLGIEGLDAFQWIPQGASVGVSYTDRKFYPMFDKIHEAGKGLYLVVNKGGVDDWAAETQKMIDRYGTRGLYFLYPRFPNAETAQAFVRRFSK